MFYSNFCKDWKVYKFTKMVSQQVKKLEELGIGRPSTYAPTLRTLQVCILFHAGSTLEHFWAVLIQYN
jgi:hypothetical protein